MPRKRKKSVKSRISFADIVGTKFGIANSQKINQLWPTSTETKKKKSKYNNIKTIVDGIKFDSKGESQRYSQLKEFERRGKIKNLELQKKYTLVDKAEAEDGTIVQALTYKADFFYFNVATGKEVTEDFKGRRTQSFIDKTKIMREKHKIEIYETGIQHIKKGVL